VKVAVVGAGTAGLAAAWFLARDGHAVTVFERVSDPRPVGAGILLQPLGQRILAEIGLADRLAACSTPVRRIDGRTRRGAAVLRFGYHDAGELGGVGLGVHRGDLFRLLSDAARDAAIPVAAGRSIVDVRHEADGWRLLDATGALEGPWDLVVAADGHRSRIRHVLGVASKDAGYPYGVVWSVVPDHEHLAGDILSQRYGGTRIALGILPTGLEQASIFWAEASRTLDATVAAGSEAWLRRARPYVGDLGRLVERVADAGIFGVRYRDVVVPRPIVVRSGHGVVLVGDAAHAMSPQLGMGASLALADAWTLARAIRDHQSSLGAGLAAHVADRRPHVRWYAWLSRLLTPAFQSDLVPMGWARDLAFGPAAKVPWVRRQFATILRGEQTSPWTSWPPTRSGGPLAGDVGRDVDIGDVGRDPGAGSPGSAPPRRC
jgi:2-polyprenyl-6-methoxyphenol hydroxylase-like FAD-dependent oxidoreductase